MTYRFDYDTRFEGKINPGYIQKVKSVGDEQIGDFVGRLKYFFNPKGIPNIDNSRLLIESKTTNITVKQDGTTLDVVFLNRDAQYNNTFGYYFYKTTDGFDPATTKKYIVFPNVMLSYSVFNILNCGDKVRLLYFDEDGNASETFPKGYTVGWFIYADGYIFQKDSQTIPHANEIDVSKPLLTSNPTNEKAGQSFITVDDKKSGKVIIGIEDGANKSYCDLLFYVEASPKESIDDPNRPDIDNPNGGDPEPEPEPVQTTTGTYAFEDIWPSGGDYDMNDMIIEYQHQIIFDENNRVKKIVDTFIPKHNGAGLTNTFAYQIDPSEPMGWISYSDGVQVEKETNSILVFTTTPTTIGQVYTVPREFMQESFPPIDKTELKKYNPYLIAGDGNTPPRTEIHLPKYKPTHLGNHSLVGTGDDAYYIKREGSYPFAIDLPILNFTPVTEKYPIDTGYPDFKT